MLTFIKNTGRINAIIVLLIIILILGIILTLKITGIIKPHRKQIETNNVTNISSDAQLENNKIEKKYKTIIEEKERTSKIITIATLLITIGLNIGICKLYSKLSLPSYIVTFNFVWPLLTIFNNMLPTEIQFIASLIATILGIMTFWYYFKAVGMSGWWAILPFVSIIIASFGMSIMLLGGSNFIGILGLGCFIAFIIAYILSNIRLANIFKKSIVFTIGLALLPFIFQPILGYQKN